MPCPVLFFILTERERERIREKKPIPRETVYI
jgi:hypothetical protein